MEKQLTPLAELIEKIKSKISTDTSIGADIRNFVLDEVIKDAQSLLPKEKQGIIKAYTDAACDYGGDGEDSEEYFNETYKQ